MARGPADGDVDCSIGFACAVRGAAGAMDTAWTVVIPVTLAAVIPAHHSICRPLVDRAALVDLVVAMNNP